MNIPEELLKQFRTVAQERIERIEAGWTSVMSVLDEQAAELLHRELHTLKGESKMLGFADVNLVCHKLEDLLEVARQRGYAVDEDFDLIVNMALRFMAMLVRKKVGAQLGGIDLPGFVKQIDSLLAEVRPETHKRTTGAMQPLRALGNVVPKVVGALRDRLGPIAVDGFVEYATARRQRRDRLRASWHSLRELVGIHRAVLGPAQLQKHRNGAQLLARELGKQVDITFDIDSVEVTAEILAAVDSAVLHLVRNALNHGVEPPDARAAAGKPERGTIRVRCHAQDQELALSVEDDGRGISMNTVRERAIEAGLIDASVTDISDRWLEIVCHPGFTTRTKASEVSGRGVGLDAVRVGLHGIGGVLTATTGAGKGTVWRTAIQIPQITFDAQVLRVPGLPFPVVLEAGWQAQPDSAASAMTPPPVPIDLAYFLGVADPSPATNVRYFARGGTLLALVVEREPTATTARRLVTPPVPAPLEIVMLETMEGVLVHLDRVR